MRQLTLWPLAAAALAVVTALAGCATQYPSPQPPPSTSMTPGCTRSGPVVFAVSGRQDSPAPGLTSAMTTAAWTAIRNGSPFGLVDIDGDPRLVLAGKFTDPGVNKPTLQQDQQNYFTQLSAAVAGVRAKHPHADVLDALDVAGRAIRAACPHGGTIYLEDSGLQETGPMNFRQPGLLTASPSDVVHFLASQHELPNLRGITVWLAGIGDTAPPQQQPDTAIRRSLIAIWTAIAKAGGASAVHYDPSPRLGIPPPRHVPDVALVPMPKQPAWTPVKTFRFPDSGPVGFLPNLAVFRNPAAATAQLRPIATYLAANPPARIELSGTTAHWGPLAGAIALSLRRAAAVKAVLVHLGAHPAQISVQGLAWRFPGYRNDRGPGGVLLPGPAEHNRSVIVTLL